MRLLAASSATLALKSALHKTKISDFTVDALGKVPPSFAFHALSYFPCCGYLYQLRAMRRTLSHGHPKCPFHTFLCGGASGTIWLPGWERSLNPEYRTNGNYPAGKR